MTPNDIYNKRFDKAVGGYKAEDVNLFMVAIGDYVQSLVSERDDLEDKLEILAEKLEEYRNDEDSLRSAIIGAQKMGDNLIKDSRQKSDIMLAEAKAKADEMIAEARYKAEIMLDDTRRSIQTEEYALESMKASVLKFRRQIMNMYEQQIRLVQQIPFDEVDVNPEPVRPSYLRSEQESDEPEEPVAVHEPVAALVYEEEREAASIGADSQEEQESRFGKLWFGEKYGLTRND